MIAIKRLGYYTYNLTIVSPVNLHKLPGSVTELVEHIFFNLMPFKNLMYQWQEGNFHFSVYIYERAY